MQRVVTGLAVLLGLLLLLIGVRWLVDPAGAAEALGASLLTGTGLTTQIGDSAGFFLGGGAMMVLGALRKNATLLVAVGLIMATVAISRVIAATFHGGDMTADAIAIEVVMMLVALTAARGIRAGG